MKPGPYSFMTQAVKNGIPPILVGVLGFLLFAPFLDVLPYISEGDTGRDLYAFQTTLQGGVPYRDYYWNYGPLMPYYYAIFFHLFGVKIPSVLLGRLVLNVISGVLIYAALRLFGARSLAVLGALWFWAFNPEYTYTFNHAGGTCVILWIVYCLLRRIQDPQYRLELSISLALFLLLLIKLNIGVAVLIAAAISCAVIHARHPGGRSRIPRRWPIFLLVPVAAAGLVYFFILKDVPSYFVSQCIPILPGYEYKGKGSFLLDALRSFRHIMWLNWTSREFEFDFNATSLFVRPWPFRILTLMGFAGFLYLIGSRFFIKSGDDNREKVKTSLLIMALFTAALSHEFIISAFDYRLHWCIPSVILAVFVMLASALEGKARWLRITIMVIVASTVVCEVNGRHLYRNTLRRMPGHYIPLERAGIYVFNQPEWVQTLVEATQRIQTLIPEEDSFLALPFNPIYYYLTEKSAPVPELIFFDRQHIGQAQQERVIADLERQGTKWIVLSNIAFPHGPAFDFGTFGQTHSLRLAQYWRENFVLVESIGDWSAPPAWINNNAIRIYRKK